MSRTTAVRIDEYSILFYEFERKLGRTLNKKERDFVQWLVNKVKTKKENVIH
ncbi:hypothetical protein JOD45_000261 [Scopulibacillus daqui]|uniref:Uncharacterized protein n=1 Tax=Scopulibacillus daqui TaxID=1469162 RepID=A0ABS2PWX8_9BACL|nr:hypothetical protein [Scopulibacillus daqui]MBM7644070.1 hypothetical protein [Scopulibacillus daqui]